MTTISHREWLRRAFLFAEAALNQEIITPGRVCITEDYFRSAFVRGLLSAKPDLAHLVRSEHTAMWSANSCHFCACAQGRGRPIQHDVAILPSEFNPGVVCEVKWTKRPSAEGIAKDIWKLLITRGGETERQAWRSYLLIGGEQPAFSETLNQLRTSGINLRYSCAGRGVTRTKVQVSLDTFRRSNLGRKSLAALTGWGARKRHYRSVPDIRSDIIITRRCEPWIQRVESAKWRAVLYELHSFGTSGSPVLAANDLYQSLSSSCQ
jgi:hypothetical protein